MTDRVLPSGAAVDRGSGAGEDGWVARWAEQRGALFRYVSYLLGGDVHAAEDVVQETAIRLWQHPEVLDEEPLSGWLRTVARNVVIDRVRHRRARPPEVELRPGLDVVDTIADDVESADTVSTALSVLSSAHRAAFYEVYIRDRPVVDVAVDLDIPVGTVKSRCHIARRRLATAIEADCA